jgi:hypothetical protein
MKNLFFLFAFSLVLLSCEKKEDTHSVLYRVGTDSPNSYTVRFTMSDGSTKSQGPITGGWSSGSMDGFEAGDELTMSLESMGGDFHMSIHANGHILKERDAGGSGGTQTLQTIIVD